EHTPAISAELSPVVLIEAHRYLSLRPREVDRDAAFRLIPEHRYRDGVVLSELLDQMPLSAFEREIPDRLPFRRQVLRNVANCCPCRLRDVMSKNFTHRDDPSRLLAKVQRVGDPQPFTPGVSVSALMNHIVAVVDN